MLATCINKTQLKSSCQQLLHLAWKSLISSNSSDRKIAQEITSSSNMNEVQVQEARRGSQECLEVSKDSSKTMRKKLKFSRQNEQPVQVVYMRSPRIIKVRPEDFRGVVQQLTGNQASMPPNSTS